MFESCRAHLGIPLHIRLFAASDASERRSGVLRCAPRNGEPQALGLGAATSKELPPV
jgi:hypothetical protein